MSRESELRAAQARANRVRRDRLAVEAAALRSLRSDVEEASRGLYVATLSNPSDPRLPRRVARAADEIAERLTETIGAARGLSRNIAFQQVEEEIEDAAARGLRLHEDLDYFDPALDHGRAVEYAHRHSRRWQGAALLNLERARLGLRPRSFAGLGDGRLQTLAATEVHEAWGNEYERLTESAARLFVPTRGRDRPETVALFRLWSTTQDERTCKECGPMDMALRPWGISFPNGWYPGRVHPRCRCMEIALMLPAYYADQDHY